jgi:hypothetical protein
MKRLFFSVFVTLLFSLSALAQSEGINFQGVARNAEGEVLVSRKINLRISILLGSESGAVAYMETRQATTNPQGVFAVVVGDDKALTKSINFSTINWTPAPKFIKVEMDPNAGSNYLVMGTSRLQAVPFAFHAYGVDASNVKGVLPASKGGTGVTSITDLKTSLGLDNFSNAALDTKVDKVAGKGLSSNDYTTAEKNKLEAITGTNTGDQDLSGYATTSQVAAKANAADMTASLATKANTADVTTSLANKVDKVTSKGLSTNDYTTAEKTKLAAITGTNTGDQDLSAYATIAMVNAIDVNSSLTGGLTTKVDKVTGKGLSTNDYTTAEKNKLAAITGTNTGDQDLSGYSTTSQLAAKANASDVTTSLATKEDISNKSNAALGTSTTFYPTQNAVKTYVDAQVASATIVDADATTRGKIQLAGDLAGTASSPTVPGLALKANTSDVTTSLATKEDASNKSNAALGTSTTLFPTQNAVKTYVDAQISNATIADADASTKGKVRLAGDLAGTNSSATSPIISNLAISTAKLAADAVTSAKILDGEIVNADISATAEIVDSKLATIASAGKVSNSATTATSGNTNSAIVARDANGNFSAGTITASLTGNATNVTGTVAVANGGTGVTTAAANLVFAGPTSGLAAAPSFRGLAASDLPSGSTSYINNTTTQQTASFNISGSGTMATNLSVGGTAIITGATTLSSLTASSPVFTDTNKQLTSSGTLGVSQGGTGVTGTPANGQILIGSGTGFTLATLSPGTGITITNSSGSISIAAAVRPTTDQFSATANQLTFTLTQTPLTNANSKDNVWMFINGVRTNNDAYSVSGTTVTYVPGSNMGYALVAGDRIQFDYAY